MKDTFKIYGSTLTGPAIAAYAITPDDGVDLVQAIRMVTLNAGGTLSYVGKDGATYATAALPAGSYPLFASRIRSTGTTATGITGWA